MRRDYLVHCYEIDRKRRLTLPALMRYFEDIATLDSEARGFTLDRYARTGQLFLLLRWDIVVRSWPRFNETVRVETRPTAFRRFLANREYAVFDGDGKPLAEARSVWVFTDMNRRRPVRVPDEMYEGFEVPRESETSFEMQEELPEIAADCGVSRIRVRDSDHDNNDHVNNVRYVEWAMESLPAGFARDREARGLKVHYRKELQSGDEAELRTVTAERDGGVFSDHSIRAGDREICRIRMEWAQ